MPSCSASRWRMGRLLRVISTSTWSYVYCGWLLDQSIVADRFALELPRTTLWSGARQGRYYCRSFTWFLSVSPLLPCSVPFLRPRSYLYFIGLGLPGSELCFRSRNLMHRWQFEPSGTPFPTCWYPQRVHHRYWSNQSSGIQRGKSVSSRTWELHKFVT